MGMNSNLASPKVVRDMLAEHGLEPSKAMGQNFLVDGNILDIIVEKSGVNSEDEVLEIGPGLGVLTEKLLAKAWHVTAVEKDVRLFEMLKSRYDDNERLDLIRADALELDWNALFVGGIDRVVANLPYSVASRILVDLFGCECKPEVIAVTLQSDVAERIVADAGSKQYGLLSILAQRVYEVELAKKIGRNCFFPRPGIDSALLLCRLRSAPLVEIEDESFFRRAVKMTFTHRRKMLVNALRGAGFGLEDVVRSLCELGIDERLRPAQLSPEQWGMLSNLLLTSSSAQR